ncbi:prepilin-type N-terminal cleavage/methylation domain-containing protein [bacterium]|nr:prepilin-type N-terminal cleavage/methylation domain-containing protein [bacterium]
MIKRKGITLIELLVVLTLSSLLISAVLYLFSTFISKSVGQERIVSSDSGTQNILNYIKWDILMAGYALPLGEMPIMNSNNTGYNNSDGITMRSLAFRNEMGSNGWTYTLVPSMGVNNLTVRRWNDPQMDIKLGDHVILLTPLKRIAGGPYTVTDLTILTETYSEPSAVLTLDQAVSISKVFVFSVSDASIFVTEVNYEVVDGKLKRGDETISDGVENLQISFWMDSNENFKQDTGEWIDDLAILIESPGMAKRIRLIRVDLLVRTKAEQGYKYTADSLFIGDLNLQFEEDEKQYRRRLWETQILPRNLF